MLADAREIARLVPMPELLLTLGFAMNERTRRCACVLHGGSNRSAFSWREDGRWHCFSCDAGGDKIALVRAVKQCGFRESVQFLAALAGTEYLAHQISHDEIERVQLERDALRSDTKALLAIEDKAWREAREAVLQLEGIQRGAEQRLDAIQRGAPERWRGELETAWAALAEVHFQMPRAAAAYNVISFAPHRERLEFALDSQAREWLVCETLECGYVADERGYRFEVQQ